MDPASGVTPLQQAAAQGSLLLLTRLLCAGVDVNKESKEGGTALHFAAYRGMRDTCEALLEGGADKGVPDAFNRSASDMARQCGFTVLGDWIDGWPYGSPRSTLPHGLLCVCPSDHAAAVVVKEEVEQPAAVVKAAATAEPQRRTHSLASVNRLSAPTARTVSRSPQRPQVGFGPSRPFTPVGVMGPDKVVAVQTLQFGAMEAPKAHMPQFGVKEHLKVRRNVVRPF